MTPVSPGSGCIAPAAASVFTWAPLPCLSSSVSYKTPVLGLRDPLHHPESSLMEMVKLTTATWAFIPGRSHLQVLGGHVRTNLLGPPLNSLRGSACGSWPRESGSLLTRSCPGHRLPLRCQPDIRRAWREAPLPLHAPGLVGGQPHNASSPFRAEHRLAVIFACRDSSAPVAGPQGPALRPATR